MPPKIQNRLKSGLWILLPLILLSFLSNRIVDDPLPVDEGVYALSVNGAENKAITGEVAFRESEVVSRNGHLLNVLRINFEEKHMNMEFLISLRSDEESIGKGKYHVNRYISSFVSEFTGVFGYANFFERGEEPYFSKTGYLHITAKSDELVQGTLEVTLVDVNGQELQLEGSFKALQH
jgi:hypothetical protein